MSLKKKGLRHWQKLIVISFVSEHVPEEEGIETWLPEPLYIFNSSEHVPEEEGIETAGGASYSLERGQNMSLKKKGLRLSLYS